MRVGLIVFLKLLLILPLMAKGAEIGILRLKPVDTESTLADGVAYLLANELTGYGRTVFNPDDMDMAAGEVLKCYEINSAVNAGIKGQVEHVIFGSVAKLGTLYVIIATMAKVSDRSVVWNGRIVAKTIEDIDVTCKRLAKSIIVGKPVDETAEVGLITAQEDSAAVRRKKGLFTMGLKFGSIVPLDGYGGACPIFVPLWFVYSYEIKNLFAEFILTLGLAKQQLEETGENSLVVTSQLPGFNLHYIFSRTDIAPFVGGGAGLSLIGYKPDNDTIGNLEIGLETNVSSGIIFFRTSNFHLIANIDYVVNFSSLPGFPGPHHGFRFGIGFTIKPSKKIGGHCV